MKIVKKIIFIFVFSILLIIFAFNLYNFVNLKILKKDLTTINGYALLQVATGSMEPTINAGDIIVIDTIVYDYKKGDIVTFYDVNGSFVTHRIVDINPKQMITKGDSNNTEDEPIPTKNLVGRYMFKLNGLGTIVSSLKNPVVSILIFIVGTLICVLMSLDDKDDLVLDEEEKKYLEQKDNKEKEKVINNSKENKDKKSNKKRKKKKR